MLDRIGIGVLLLAGAAATAWAHTGGSTGYVTITINWSIVRYGLTLSTSALPSDLAEALRLAQMGNPKSREKLLDVVRTRIVLHANGARCEPGRGHVLFSGVDATSFTIVVDFACVSVVRELDVQDNIFDVLGTDHHTLAKLEAPSGIQQFAFAPDARWGRFVIGDQGAGAQACARLLPHAQGATALRREALFRWTMISAEAASQWINWT